jgi:hypothetical protein
MITRFGYGYEKKSKYSPSTQHARALFLELIPSLKQEVVPDLFTIAYQPFLELLANNQDEFNSIKNSLESDLLGHPNFTPETIMDLAVERFIPNWQTLQSREDAASLCGKLREWSSTWNLTNDWCLDYAFKTLQKGYLMSLNYIWLDNYDAWRDANTELRLESFCMHAVSNEEIEEKGLFEFKFHFEEINFSVTGPFNKSTSEFKQEVNDKFKAAGGKSIRGASTALKLKMGEYLEKISAVMEDQNLTEPPIRWAINHFKWLICFQIPPNRRTISELSRDFSKDRKTIREGINDVANLIVLDLKPMPKEIWKVRAGRPKNK